MNCFHLALSLLYLLMNGVNLLPKFRQLMLN